MYTGELLSITGKSINDLKLHYKWQNEPQPHFERWNIMGKFLIIISFDSHVASYMAVGNWNWLHIHLEIYASSGMVRVVGEPVAQFSYSC